MSTPDFDSANWRKSSHSAENGTCVEVAFAGSTVGVRDSTSPDSGLVCVNAVGWAEFLRRVERHR